MRQIISELGPFGKIAHQKVPKSKKEKMAGGEERIEACRQILSRVKGLDATTGKTRFNQSERLDSDTSGFKAHLSLEDLDIIRTIGKAHSVIVINQI